MLPSQFFKRAGDGYKAELSRASGVHRNTIGSIAKGKGCRPRTAVRLIPFLEGKITYEELTLGDRYQELHAVRRLLATGTEG